MKQLIGTLVMIAAAALSGCAGVVTTASDISYDQPITLRGLHGGG